MIFPSDNSFVPLAMAGVLALICGLLPVLLTESVERIHTNEGYTIVLCAWITAWLFGALPFIFYGGESSFINALFESISQTQLFILMYLGLVFIGIELNLCSGMDLKSGVSAAIAWYGSYAGRAS